MAIRQKLLEKALNTLKKTGLLSGEGGQKNQDLLLAQQNKIETLDAIANVLTILQRARILSHFQGQANYTRVMQNLAHIEQVAEGLAIFEHEKWLQGPAAQANFAFIMSNPEHASSLAAGLVALHKANILKECQSILLANQKDASGLANAIVMMNRAGLLKGEQGKLNRDLLIKNKEEAEGISRAFHWLDQAGLLTQPNFDAFFRYSEFLEEIVEEIEAAAITERLTATVFGAIIDSKRIQREAREQAIFAALMPPVETVVVQGFFKPAPTTSGLPIVPLVDLVCDYLR